MKNKSHLYLLYLLLAFFVTESFAAGLENRSIKITNNDRFHFVNGSGVQFKFRPLSDEARTLEITKNASSLGVAYLGQVQLKENTTPLSALRSIADQIGNSLNLSFGVIADSNTSEALKSNELLLLYHPAITITLALARPNEDSNYEIICTYALKDMEKKQPKANQKTLKNTQATTETSDTEDMENEKQQEMATQ